MHTNLSSSGAMKVNNARMTSNGDLRTSNQVVVLNKRAIVDEVEAKAEVGTQVGLQQVT